MKERRRICTLNSKLFSAKKSFLICRLVPHLIYAEYHVSLGIIVALQEEYIKDEMRNLKRELIRAKEVSTV